MDRPRLLFSTAPFFRLPLREAFRSISAAGYTAVEVMVTADPATQEPHLLRNLAEEHGLEIVSIHAPMLLFTRRVWGADPVPKIYRTVQLAQELEAALVVVHPPYRWQVRFRRWVEGSMAELSARTGVTVAIENMFPVRMGGERSLTFHSGQELEELDRFPYLVLDTSHAAVARLDILEALDRYRHNLVHVHVSNNAGKGWDSHLPVYEGILPVDQFLEKLAADSFAGTVALELDLRRFLDDEEELLEVLVRNREFCEARMRVTA